jgi:hypothetical protein
VLFSFCIGSPFFHGVEFILVPVADFSINRGFL